MVKWQGHIVIAVLLMILAQFHTEFWAWWYVILAVIFTAWGAVDMFKDVSKRMAAILEDE